MLEIAGQYVYEEPEVIAQNLRQSAESVMRIAQIRAMGGAETTGIQNEMVSCLNTINVGLQQGGKFMEQLFTDVVMRIHEAKEELGI